VQIYKKVLLLLLLTCFLGFNLGCQKKVLPTSYPNKPGFFPITTTFKEYRLHRKPVTSCTPSRIDNKKNDDSEKAKKELLNYQKKGREEHIKRQTHDVKKRMKESLAESEKLRKRKTFWDKVMIWIKGKIKSKNKH
jgi:hypothetical protein